MPTSAHQVQALYVEYLGRPADPASLASWVTALDNNTATLWTVTNALVNSAEFKAAWAGLSPDDIVSKIFQQLIGRVPDQEGKAFWISYLKYGYYTIDGVISTISVNVDGADLAVLNNKIAAAEAFTAGLDTSPELIGYASAAAAELARAYLLSVTNTAALNAALAALPDTIAKVTGTPINHAPSGKVVITGTLQEGQVLTASHTLADVDGLGTVTYQWRVAGVDLSDVTGDTLTLTAALAGKPISVVASYTDGIGTHEAITSNSIIFGNDTLAGTAGVDTLAGGIGDDTYIVNVAGDVIVENPGEGVDLVKVALTAAGSYALSANVENATVTSSAAVSVVGNALANVLTGNAAANTLTGGDGNDTLDGGAGADKLIGGAGDDLYVVDNSGDVITENPGEGADTVRTALASLTLAANVENLVYNGTAAFTAVGNAEDNIITGGAKGNKLDGGAGNDSLIGGIGNDSLTGGLGNDTFTGAGGKDTVDGGDGIDLLQGLKSFNEYTFSRPNATDTVLTDQAGNTITVRGVENFDFGGVSKTLDDLQYNIVSLGNDKLYGNNDNNTLDGGAGADTMTGYSGDDTYIVDNAGDVVVEDLAAGHDLVLVKFSAAGAYQLTDYVEDATLAAGAAVKLNGNAADNYLTGNAAANVLSGGGGDDTLDGGAGADQLAGGQGNDLYLVDNAGDQIIEAQGEGYDMVQTALASYTLSANVEVLTYTGKGAFSGTGSASDNLIRGSSAGANKLDGGAGDDYLIGGTAADSLLGGSGNDTLYGGAGKDTLDGGDGIDVAWVDGDSFDFRVSRPNSTDTVLTDAAGHVIVLRNVETVAFNGNPVSIAWLQYNIVSPGDDVLAGRENVAPETIDGGLGADTMSGGGGDDTYMVDNVGDTLVEAMYGGLDTARVTLSTANATYTLGDNVENGIITSSSSVNLSGNAGNNLLTGNAAANTLSGGGGNDTLDGGAGADKLIGGAGDDVYLVADSGDVVTEAPGEGYDTVRTTLASYTLAANVEELEYKGKAAFTGIGNGGDNAISGGDGGAKLDGGAGNDTLYGGAGNDSLLGGSGDDSLIYSGGKDTIDGGDGIDALTINGAREAFTVSRPNATDLLLTGAGGKQITVRNVEHFSFQGADVTLDELLYNVVSVANDKLYGGSGQDTLNGGLGADTMTGYEDDDRYVVDNVGDTIVESLYGGIDTAQVELGTAGATYTLGDNVENGIISSSAAVNLNGNALGNQLTGNAAVNTLSGGAGDDTLDGGAGNDKLLGGEGDDVYLVADAGDTIVENAGQGWDTVRTALASYALSANVEQLEYTGKAAFTGTGSAGGDVIKGGNGGAKLDGGGGDDQLFGGTGNDSLQGGSGNDMLYAGKGQDTLDGGAGSADIAVLAGAPQNYTISRPTATDTVLTDSAGNTVTLRNVEFVEFDGIVHDYSIGELTFNLASPGADHLSGTAGDDTLNGAGGADTLEGGYGDDTYVVTDKATVIVEQQDAGTDLAQVAYTSAGAYTLAENLENATITAAATVAVSLNGNGLNNWLTGNGAANTLSGFGGNDTLDGGAGADRLVGGAGDDVYVVTEAGDVVVELADEGFDMVSTTLSSYTLAANVEAVFASGAGLFTGTGNAQANMMVAGGGGSKLDGGDGNDWLIGGAGNDSLLGGLGDDLFNASLGQDTVDGGAGVNRLQSLDDFDHYSVLRVNSTDTLLTHLSGATTLVRNVQWFDFNGTVLSLEQMQEHSVSMGSDTVIGTSGDDTLDGGPGNDVLIGGDGDDYYWLSAPGDQVVEQADAGIDGVRLDFASAGSYTLAANVEYAIMVPASTVAISVVGNGQSNYLSGNAGANSLSGGGGNDTLDGGGGNDILIGGLGDDQYLVGESGDVIKENAGEGYETVFASAASYTLSANLEDLVFNGTGAFTGIGNGGDNRLFAGSSSGAKLDGGSGNDTLVGAAGNDNLIGGTGNDHIESNGGSDTVDGGAGDDYILGLGARDSYSVVRTATDTVLTGSDGTIVTVRGVETFYFADRALTLAQLQANTGGPGNDSLMGTDGNDTLDGGAGADTLAGGAGDDVYRVDHSGDRVIELADGGIDRVETTLASYTLGAYVENLRYTGKAAFTGTGNALDNILQGGAGSDKLAGGLGSDTFVVANTTGSDVITDFVSGVDHLALDLAGLGLDTVNLRMGVHDVPGGFEVGDQLSLFTARAANSTTASAAAVIGSATSAYAVGDTALFVVATAKDSTLYRFVSSGADAQVSAGELTALVTLTGTPATALDDYVFA